MFKIVFLFQTPAFPPTKKASNQKGPCRLGPGGHSGGSHRGPTPAAAGGAATLVQWSGSGVDGVWRASALVAPKGIKWGGKEICGEKRPEKT